MCLYIYVCLYVCCINPITTKDNSYLSEACRITELYALLLVYCELDNKSTSPS